MAKSKGGNTNAVKERIPEAKIVADEDHPAFVFGKVDDGDELIDPTARGPAEQEEAPLPTEARDLGPLGEPVPLDIPHRIPGRWPIPFPRLCQAVSGRYRMIRPIATRLPTPIPLPGPRVPVPWPIIPINFQTINVRVDVDRFYPQNRISIEVNRLFPSRRAHAIAEVTSDSCRGFNNRTIIADIVYCDGDVSLIPGTTLTFKARRTTGFSYGKFEIVLSGGGITPRTYQLGLVSDKFDKVEFEVDRVQNAGSIVTSIDTHDHPNRPAGLPAETLSLETVYERAGFDVSMSPNTTVIPTADAGANGTWSDTEMHNAMVTYWSRFGNRPNWAMWVLYAARHDRGRSLGGVMFDDIGPNHRQGTAIFTDSFIKDVPAGETDAEAWKRRMEFWTAVHEMGHGFNLAHSWQKALGVTDGAPGDPWVPLANEPEARSFMNYPYRVSGGQSAFFSNFEFRFSDDELLFMRHAPRRFVQMGNSDWFVNHGFEAPDELDDTGTWSLEIRPNRSENAYRFLEPVAMELKLTNSSDRTQMVNEDMVAEASHITVFIQREGGLTRRWSPMITRFDEPEETALEPGKSLYGAHLISASAQGWTIDESGFYKVQAAINMGEEIVVSNVLRLYVAPPLNNKEAKFAPEYFTEEVGRAIAFQGAPALDKAMDLLKTVGKELPDHPAALHAKVAIANPGLRDFKILDASGGREDLALKSVSATPKESAKLFREALLSDQEAAADTLGHIRYFGQLRSVSEALEDSGDDKAAVDVLKKSVAFMKKRDILPRVIDNAEARLDRRT